MSPQTFPVMPGVPAAGHVTAGGAWHPGAASSCHKGPCDPVIRRPRVGDRIVTARYGDCDVLRLLDRDGIALAVRDSIGREWVVERARNGHWTRPRNR